MFSIPAYLNNVFPIFYATQVWSSFKHKFTVANRGVKIVEANIPEGAKSIKAVISGQTEMLKLALFASDKNTPSSKNSTWSNLPNWRKAFSCSKNNPNAGNWKVKIEGADHVGKLNKIKSVSGMLTTTVDGGK